MKGKTLAFHAEGLRVKKCHNVNFPTCCFMFVYVGKYQASCMSRFTWFHFCMISLWHGLKIYTTFLNLHNNCWFNTIWHRWSVAALHVLEMPSFMCMDWLRRWYNHVADVVPSSTALAFVTKMNEKHKYINLRHLVQSKWKFGKRQSIVKSRCNKPTWKSWTDCWQMP